MARIHLIDRSKRGYTAATLEAEAVGGIMAATAGLAEALADRGHEVTVFGSLGQAVRLRGVTWTPLATQVTAAPDLAIANDRPGLLWPHRRARHHAVWCHNRVSLNRLLRRANLRAVLGLRPAAVFLGAGQAAATSRLIPWRRRLVLGHGVGAPFLALRDAAGATAPRHPPPPVVLFTAQPYRGLAWLLALWRTHVHPALPTARLVLHVTKPDQLPADLAAHGPLGVELGPALPPAALAQRLAAARVVALPGHRDETFCLAAAEAIACGTPVVTRGLGALAERVREGVTGSVEPNPEGFARALLTLLCDDGVWQARHRACLADPGIVGWAARAQAWEQAFAHVARP